MFKSPKAERAADCQTLEQLPNIGPAMAADLRRLGIRHPAELQAQDPLRARHLHGGHRLHARGRAHTVVALHGPPKTGVRPGLTAAENWRPLRALFRP
jgi:nucleotidyltransferase/DNA polymerase involved in DNA repair